MRPDLILKNYLRYTCCHSGGQTATYSAPHRIKLLNEANIPDVALMTRAMGQAARCSAARDIHGNLFLLYQVTCCPDALRSKPRQPQETEASPAFEGSVVSRYHHRVATGHALRQLRLQTNRKHHGYNNANAPLFHRFNAGGNYGCRNDWLSGGPEPGRRGYEEALC